MWAPPRSIPPKGVGLGWLGMVEGVGSSYHENEVPLRGNNDLMEFGAQAKECQVVEGVQVPRHGRAGYGLAINAGRSSWQ